MNQTAQLNWANDWLAKPKQLYINGTWQKASGNRQFENCNPSNGRKLTNIPVANQQDVALAVGAAKSAFESGCWSNTERRFRGRTLQQLAEVIRNHIGELATLETLANGKLFKESCEDIIEAADLFDYYAGWVDKYYAENCPVGPGFLNYTVHEPVGVCGLIVPWNFPLLLACWKIAPALAMGNTVVVKPSEYTSLSLIRLFELIDEKLDLPSGVVNLVLGDAETGNAISSSDLIDKVSFTGSTAVGRLILGQAATSNLKRVTLELGGKSPNIIFDDTPDLEAAIERSFVAMFSHKAEKCSEPTKLIVHESVYERVLAGLESRARSYRCGDPFSATSQQGAQCNEAQFNKILNYIAIGKQECLTLLTGGERDTSPECANGFYIRPTIFTDVPASSQLAKEEIFGPVLVVMKFKDDSEAIELANASPYGLAAGLWTANITRAHRVAEKINAGMVFINRYGMYDFASPFGGFKQSGWGKEMGIHSLASYTKTKSIWVKL